MAATEDGAPRPTFTPDLIRAVAAALDSGEAESARRIAAPLHSADLADLLEGLNAADRVALLAALGPALDADVLVDLDEHVRDGVLETIDDARLAAAAAELDSGDAAALVETLEEDARRRVLDAMPDAERRMVEAALSWPESSAGRLMRRDTVAVPAYWTVGQTIDWLRESDGLPDEFYEIFVVDPSHRPVGSVPLYRAMRNRRGVGMSALTQPDLHSIPVDMDREEVAYRFEHYDLASAAVVGADGRLLGQIVVDDVMDVMREEAEEDIHRLGGVTAEGDIHLGALGTVRRRWAWLLVNLATAALASLTIALFAETIEQIVALAILMPIVASMGGNAGTQTLTVAVRALATRELNAANAARILWKECAVGSTNGVVFAALAGGAAALWFGDPALGATVGAAMVVNLLVAGASGMLIPLALARAGVDPAVSGGVLLTTVTDVVGFFAFLGLARLVLL